VADAGKAGIGDALVIGVRQSEVVILEVRFESAGCLFLRTLSIGELPAL